MHVFAIRPQPRAKIEQHNQFGVPAVQSAPGQMARQLPLGQTVDQPVQVQRAAAADTELSTQCGQQSRLGHQILVADQASGRRRSGACLVDGFGPCCRDGGRFVLLRRWPRQPFGDDMDPGHAQGQLAGWFGGPPPHDAHSRHNDLALAMYGQRFGGFHVAEPGLSIGVERQLVARRQSQQAQEVGAAGGADRLYALGGCHQS